MTAVLIIVLLLLAGAGGAFLYVATQKNRQANIERSDEIRKDAATQAQGTIAPAQERAAVAEAEAEEARVAAEKAEAEAAEARLAAQQEEAAHEARLRAADRLDPRVNEKADDYAPQVPSAEPLQQPVPASEVEPAPAEPTAPEPAPAAEEPTAEEPTAEEPATGAQAPLLPRRTPGAQEMPGKPIEQTDDGGGWFTKQPPRSDSDQS